MKKIYSLLLLIICSYNLLAQTNDSLKLRHHEIGVNMTSLINQLIPGADNEIQLSPYLITYHFTGVHHAFRFGFGLFSNSKIDNDTIIVLSHSSFGFDARTGYEYRVQLTRRWSTAFGVDGKYGRGNSHVKTSTNAEVVTVGNRSWTVGGGPVITIRFDVNNRIRLSTECTLYHSYSELTNYQDFENFPEFNTEKTSILNGMTITAPINLYLSVRL